MAIDKRKIPEINAGSMADIAFLLLIFFLVTTTISNDKGLQILLPPKRENDIIDEVKLKEHNVFTVLVNSKNQLFVEKDVMNIKVLRAEAKKFISNRGKDKTLSDSPEKGVISLKTDRGTKYSIYLAVLDELKAAYHELRAEFMGISIKEYLEYDSKKATNELRKKYEAAKKAFPLNISEAEPTNIES